MCSGIASSRPLRIVSSMDPKGSVLFARLPLRYPIKYARNSIPKAAAFTTSESSTKRENAWAQ